MSSPPHSLDQWLNRLEQLHPKAIDLGLERVHHVARCLNLLKPPSPLSHPYSGALNSDAQVVTVAGTNGKGSCIASLEAALLVQGQLAQGASVARYTSPHLHHFCERICINGEPVSDALVCEAFTAVDKARADTSLTYFEFGTLAALWIFIQQQVAYVLLEVGLGGRLDAVNIIDADVALITSIDLDHQEWLGSDRDSISQEKLGIARIGRPLIIAEANVTPSLERAIHTFEASAINRDFSFSVLENVQESDVLESNVQESDGQGSEEQWRCQIRQQTLCLPLPSLPLNSVAAALCAMQALGFELHEAPLAQLMPRLRLPGRMETQDFKGLELTYDVAHNPAAIQYLAQQLKRQAGQGRCHAVVAFMADKAIESMLALLDGMFEHWYVGDINHNTRAMPAQALAQLLRRRGQHVTVANSLEQALAAAIAQAQAHDRIVVFGSFFTVACAQQWVAEVGESTHYKTVSQTTNQTSSQITRE